MRRFQELEGFIRLSTISLHLCENVLIKDEDIKRKKVKLHLMH